MKKKIDEGGGWRECAKLVNVWVYLCVLIILKYNVNYVYKVALIIVHWKLCFADLLNF